MENQRDPRRGTVREVARVGKWAMILASIVAITVPAVWFFWLTERGIKVTEKGIEEADKWKRTIGGHEHKPDPSLSANQLKVRAFTVGTCIDTEGETPECREDAEDVTIDVYVRLGERFPNTSPEDITTKSYAWLPNDFQYPVFWRDRPLELIERGREACIARLRPKVEDRVRKGPNVGCGDKIQRPGFHLGGKLGGESGARKRVSQYPQDQMWLVKQGNRKCRIKVHCSR